MPDEPRITRHLLRLYSPNDWLMRFNTDCFIYFSGINKKDRNSRILDCGCALGHLIKRLCALGFKNVCGLDAAPEMAEAARENTGCRIIQADALKITDHFSPGSIDILVISDLLHHITAKNNWVTLLEKIRTVLTDSGTLIIREPSPTLVFKMLYNMAQTPLFYHGPLKNRLHSYVEEKEFLQYFFSNWLHEYPEILMNSGFKIKKDFVWIVHRITACEKDFSLKNQIK